MLRFTLLRLWLKFSLVIHIDTRKWSTYTQLLTFGTLYTAVSQRIVSFLPPKSTQKWRPILHHKWQMGCTFWCTTNIPVSRCGKKAENKGFSAFALECSFFLANIKLSK